MAELVNVEAALEVRAPKEPRGDQYRGRPPKARSMRSQNPGGTNSAFDSSLSGVNLSMTPRTVPTPPSESRPEGRDRTRFGRHPNAARRSDVSDLSPGSLLALGKDDAFVAPERSMESVPETHMGQAYMARSGQESRFAPGSERVETTPRVQRPSDSARASDASRVQKSNRSKSSNSAQYQPTFERDETPRLQPPSDGARASDESRVQTSQSKSSARAQYQPTPERSGTPQLRRASDGARASDPSHVHFSSRSKSSTGSQHQPTSERSGTPRLQQPSDGARASDASHVHCSSRSKSTTASQPQSPPESEAMRTTDQSYAHRSTDRSYVHRSERSRAGQSSSSLRPSGDRSESLNVLALVGGPRNSIDEARSESPERSASAELMPRVVDRLMERRQPQRPASTAPTTGLRGAWHAFQRRVASIGAALNPVPPISMEEIRRTMDTEILAHSERERQREIEEARRRRQASRSRAAQARRAGGGTEGSARPSES